MASEFAHKTTIIQHSVIYTQQRGKPLATTQLYYSKMRNVLTIIRRSRVRSALIYWTTDQTKLTSWRNYILQHDTIYTVNSLFSKTHQRLTERENIKH
jgi:hypothetical protein